MEVRRSRPPNYFLLSSRFSGLWRRGFRYRLRCQLGFLFRGELILDLEAGLVDSQRRVPVRGRGWGAGGVAGGPSQREMCTFISRAPNSLPQPLVQGRKIFFPTAFGGVTEPRAGNGRRVDVKFAVGTIKPTFGLRLCLRRHGPSYGLDAGCAPAGGCASRIQSAQTPVAV